jgi:hypothetical protein
VLHKAGVDHSLHRFTQTAKKVNWSVTRFVSFYLPLLEDWEYYDLSPVVREFTSDLGLVVYFEKEC